MTKEILIKNGIILTMEKDIPVLENGALLVKDNTIAEITTTNTPALNTGDMEIIDASGAIVMPGLVNCHTHLPMSLFRGLADDLPLDKWLNNHIFPAEAKQINKDSVKKWALHSCCELIRSGTTTCCDGYFYEDQVAQAILASGLRGVAGQGVLDFPAPGVPDPGKNIEHAAEFAEKWKNISSCIQPSIFCHSPYTCSDHTLKQAKKASRALGILFQIHVAETEKEAALSQKSHNLSPVEHLERLGILDEHTLLSHGVWVDEKDAAIIKKTGAGIVHCAKSNMKLASGIAPVPMFMKHGIILGLGTDGSASNNSLDLFSEMDCAAKLHKCAAQDPCAVKAVDVLTMATLGGAAALGLDHEIGSLKKGKKADIIIIDCNKPHLVPLYDPFSALVYQAKGSDVCLVMVDGRIIYKAEKNG
ncbi:MAG: amidohydrolase [Desulfobacteraceae bacterium]